MIISVLVKANKKEEKILETGPDTFEVWTKAPAKEGRANVDVANQIAEYFGVSKSRVTLRSGARSKMKRFLIG